MFEGVLEKILQQKLGKYLEGFDKQNLSIGFFSGNILLENLQLKQNLFQQLGFPLRMIFGKIKKLHIKVPWTKLQSAPVELLLDTLMIVVAPLEQEHWKAKSTWSFDFKRKLLDEVSQIMAAKLKMSMASKQSEVTKEEGFVDRIATKIVDNIQVTIKNIHIRFEDDAKGQKSSQYSLGFTLQEIGINTTNQGWEKTFFDRNVKENRKKPIYKRLQIQGLAFYVHFHAKHKVNNTDQAAIQQSTSKQQSHVIFEFSSLAGNEQQQLPSQVLSSDSFKLVSLESDRDIETRMQEMFPKNATKIQNIPYVIEPIFLELKMTQLTKVEKDEPMFKFDVKLDELSISLNKKQYEIIFQIADYFKQYTKFIERFNMVKKYKYLRPVYPIKFKAPSQTFKPISFDCLKQQASDLFAQSALKSLEQTEEKKAEEDESFFNTSASSEKKASGEGSLIPYGLSTVQNLVSDQTVPQLWWKYAITSVMKDRKFKQGFWNEFKVTSWRKREYGKHMIKICSKCLSPDFLIDVKKLQEEDRLLLIHIFEANDLNDLQNWMAIVVKRKIEKEIALEQQKQQKEKESSFFGSLFGGGGKKTEKKNEDKSPGSSHHDDIESLLTDEEIEKIQLSIKQLLSDAAPEDLQDFTLSEQERNRQVKFFANFVFKSGRIHLFDETCRVELYQDELSVNFTFRRDTTLDVIIGNKSVGLNVFDLTTNIIKEIVTKQARWLQRRNSEFEEEKSAPIGQLIDKDNLQWQLQISKTGDLQIGFMTEIIFESNPIRVKYDASAITKISKFFQTGTSEELRAQAYDKISALKDSTQSSLKDLLYKKSNKITVRIASPILELPFKAHNSFMIGESEEQSDRKWILNLGNIDFQTNSSEKTQKSQELDEYERFKLIIDSFGLQYVKHGRNLSVIDQVEMKLDIGIKNKIKAALIEGTDKPSQLIIDKNDIIVQQKKFSPEVIVNAKLPHLVGNFTPDVYNALVNLSQVLISEGQDEHLKRLKVEKDQIIRNSYYHHEEVLTRGIRGSISSYWQSNFLIISGSYIYFYKSRRDLMPHHYIYISDCQISSQVDLKDLPAIQNKQIEFKNALLVKQRSGDILYLKFNDAHESEEFMQIIVKAQQDLQGEINVLQKQDILSDLIHKDQQEVGFSMGLEVGKVELKIWQTTEKAIQDQFAGTFDNQWLRATVCDLDFSMQKFQYEIKLLFSLSSLCFRETLFVNEDMLINEPGQNLCRIELDIYDIYSPNLQDAEIIVNVQLSKLLWLFEPNMINTTFKFFRNTKTFEIKDLEGINVQLMDESEKLLDDYTESTKTIRHGKKMKGGHQHQSENCRTIDLILVKTNVVANGITLITVHHQYFTPLFDLSVGKFVFSYDMHYDHDVMVGDFSNAKVFDLTNYPFTYDPSKTQKASLANIESFQRYEIIGIKEAKQSVDQLKNSANLTTNAIQFKSTLYTDKCPLHPPGITSKLSVEVASVKIVFFYEQAFRIIDYFMDKLLWSITESDPYLQFGPQGQKLVDQIDVSHMSVQEIERLDMKQEKNTMIMEFKIHRPSLILKDRPHLKSNLEMDLGEITISYDENLEKGRFLKAPNKELQMSKFIIDCQEVTIKHSDDFKVSQKFNLKLDFSFLSATPMLLRIDSHQLDKSFFVDMQFTPQLHLRLREDVYTFILRTVDLNFAYTDYLEDKFLFKNDEEYFKSTDYLIKSKTIIRTDFLALSLYNKEEEQLTQLGVRQPNIVINYFLNRRHNYDIKIEEINSFFTDTNGQNLILFGNINEKHWIDSFEEMKDCLFTPKKLPSNLLINISMYPDGSKFFKIEVKGLKLFLHPYFYLMIDHFFREGQPVYDMKSIDKPNEYSEDYEEYPVIHSTFSLTDSLICFAACDNLSIEDSVLGIGCQANFDFEFRREKIKNVKSNLWEKIKSTSSLDDKADLPTQLPISWIRILVKEVSPYICEIQDLEDSSFKEVTKRQIIQPFDTMIHFAKFLQYRPKERKLFNYHKSEIKLEKVVLKTSYQDVLLLQAIGDEFSKSYQKFNVFYQSYLSLKKQQPQIQIMESKPKHKMSIRSLEEEKKSFEGSLALQQSDPKAKFMSQVLDYEADPEFQLIKYISQGVQIVLINDYNNIFSPILTVNLQDFEYKNVGEFSQFNGRCLVKAMISYYNPSASEWEPLIEKVKVEFISNHYKGQIFHLISLRSDFNVNVTTELMQILISTMQQLEKINDDKRALQQEANGRDQPSASLPFGSSRESAFSRRTTRVVPPHLQDLVSYNRATGVSARPTSQMLAPRSQLECKVTPYSIVNYSSRVIFVKSVFYTKNTDRLKEYIIPPGERVDYEVDYEEEVKHLMRESNDEVVKKQDFLNVSFERSPYQIKDINLRNQNFYHHFICDKNKDDYVAYGVKFENMKKVLIIRAPFVFNNLTDVNYKLRLLKIDGTTVLKTITMVPGQCYPIDVKELEYKFQLSNDFTENEWSSPIRIKTIVEKVPKGATTYLYHGKQFTIITKEKTECQKNYNINFKTPVIIKNALPCNLKIRTDIILGKLLPSHTAYKGKEDDNFQYEQKEIEIKKSESLKLHNFNLKSSIAFLFTLNPDQAASSEQPQSKSPSYQWGEFLALNKEFKEEKSFMIKDSGIKDCPALQVFVKMRRCKQAGVRLTFYVKNIIVNNTDQRMIFYYQNFQQQPASGQLSTSDNSVVMLNDKQRVFACLEDRELQLKSYSKGFNIDIAGVTNTIQIKKQDSNAFHEFSVKTELSRACDDEEVYTKVTIISPCFVLLNKTRKTILITQEDCLEQCQIVLSGSRVPFFWKDLKKPKLVQIKCIEKEGAEYDDDSHDWTCKNVKPFIFCSLVSFALDEIGRMTIINRHKRSLNRSKYLRVEKQLQEENQILFVSFHEETPQFSTYKLENHSKHVHIEYHQKDYPHNPQILLPEQNQIFSWTNPRDSEYKITCKFFGSSAGTQQEGDYQNTNIDIEPDNLELNEKFELPQHLCQRHYKYLYIYTITNGFSKILVFSDISQEASIRAKNQQMDLNLQEVDEIQTKTFRLEMLNFGLSLTCYNYKAKRKEFAYIYLEDLKFIVLEAERKREVQLKLGYLQIDNNIVNKPLFPVIMYPKELVNKRDKALEKKRKHPQDNEVIEIKEFFNMHFTTRMDVQEVLFIEEINFLVQTMVIQTDDEFLSYIYKFSSEITDLLHTNITGIHSIFKESSRLISDLPLPMDPVIEKFLNPSEPKVTLGGVAKEESKNEQSMTMTMLMNRPAEVVDKAIQGGWGKSLNQPRQTQQFTLQKVSTMVNYQEGGVSKGGLSLLSSSVKKKTGRATEKAGSTSPSKRGLNDQRITLSSQHTSISSAMNAFSQQNQQSWLNYDVEVQAKKMLYINKYQSSPIDIELSYITKAKTDNDEQANKKVSIRDKMMNFGLPLVNLESAQCRINSLSLKNIFGTPNDINFQLQSHYLVLLKKNIFRVVGASNLLGNPAKFVTHLGTGMKEFFYLPIEGAVKGPLEAGKGIVMGTHSLVKNTVQGTFGSASKVLSTMSKGLLMIANDGEFINKREETNTQEKPRNVIEGVGYGLKSTLTGIAAGVTGIVEKPIQGAKSGGVKGFFKGTYKGVSGLVVKPISGALDFFSKTSEGIKNTAGPQQKKVKKIRVMRPFYGKLQLIKIYNQLHAEVLQMLCKADKGRYSTTTFLDAILYNDLGERKQKVIIMTEELFLIMDPAHREVLQFVSSEKVMTVVSPTNGIIQVFVVDKNQDLKEGLKLKIDEEKQFKRSFKVLQNYVYHVRTEMSKQQSQLHDQTRK